MTDQRERDTLEADWATSDDDRCEVRQRIAGLPCGQRCALKRGHEGEHVFGAPPYEWK